MEFLDSFTTICVDIESFIFFTHLAILLIFIIQPSSLKQQLNPNSGEYKTWLIVRDAQEMGVPGIFLGNLKLVGVYSD
jgi:hypothetical protein